ncbi:hypothetical protein [Acidihalobacter ferrooxydans]|uniref:PsbP C-terminal domain-containing protein n=1 Tax=Acidihalobacter ferrooxydans TaxID=1765967 RepID=A0A1P8UF57_9GAMM|nr:hypothetical protein [Acidihalobacter ferrooxydans]APZ42404.1 hypothetical protein BW247_04295 [Acidihalobacter ferrooxydans]
MPTPAHVLTALLAAPLGLGALPAQAQTPPAAQAPIAPLQHPVGDIPDTQVFVRYHSPLGFSLEVPEGWARSTTADGVRFVSRLDGIVITARTAHQAPSVASVRAQEIPALKRAGRAVRISAVTQVRLPAGKVVKIAYSDNSAPNPVTGKQVREERWRFLYFRQGREVAVDFYAPYGADNVDQWHRMSQSFRWSRP